jgi:hypothetical protein
MYKEYFIKKLKEKFKTNKEFDQYQQRIITEGNRANHDDDLSSWSELDWFIWESGIQELY